jgi:hypothetical protein
LFRGDTEFALMEKVRKAEVPPPSGFNRRVTPELDAITLKALARDVADRYQTAAQLAADLDALIAGYRFDPKELRQFMRQLFRKEYAKELEEIQTALEAQPGMSVYVHRQPTANVETPTEPRHEVVEIIEASEVEPSVREEPDKPRGFWGSLFKRKK